MPVFFAGAFDNTSLLWDTLAAFVAFSLSASAIYILNDYMDIGDDRKHPTKCDRPLASGAVTVRTALALATGLLVSGVGLMALLSIPALAVLGLYVALNVGYSIWLKHFAIIDISIISLGFVLRLLVGSLVSGIPLSSWIVIMTFLLALFIALAKRRDDLILYLDTGKKARPVIDGYNLQMIDSAMAIMASVVIVSFLLYTTSSEVTERLQSEYVYLTTIFVIIGIMRYLQLTFVYKRTGSPTRIVMQDNLMRATVLAWLVAFGWIIYL